MDIMEKGFWKDLNKTVQFPKEGIFSTVLAMSKTYNYTLMCLSAGTNIDTHTSTKAGVVQVLVEQVHLHLSMKRLKWLPGYLFSCLRTHLILLRLKRI